MPDCGRPAFSGGLCRGHYGRRGRPDALAPLRTKRPAGKVETVGGLSLSRDAADAIRAEAAARSISEHAVMVEVLERWAETRKQGA